MFTKVYGISLIIIALAVGIVPYFTQCDPMVSMGKVSYMKCHWTALSEITVGAPLLVVGAMLPFTRRKSGINMLSILGIVLGAAVVFLPNGLIGVCPSGMPCHTVMKPALTVLGGLTIVGGLTRLILARRSTE